MFVNNNKYKEGQAIFFKLSVPLLMYLETW